MEIIKDLPEVFEEFAEQRKNSFLAVKELKDKGVPVVGAYLFPAGDCNGDGSGYSGLMFYFRRDNRSGGERPAEELMSVD